MVASSTFRMVAFILLISLMSSPTPACSCFGTQSIGIALRDAESIVVGRVKSHHDFEYREPHPRSAGIVVEVLNTLKGDSEADVEIAESLMCYQSFSREDFAVGKTFVFPLTRIVTSDAPGATKDGVDPSSLTSRTGSVFGLPVCSHTALLVEGDTVFTNELTSDGKRELKPYMSMATFRAAALVGAYDSRKLTVIVVALLAAFIVVVMRRKQPKVSQQHSMGDSSVIAVCFVARLDLVANFYRELLQAVVLVSDNQHLVLDCRGFRLMIHEIPGAGSGTEEPERRERTALRLDFPVTDIDVARRVAKANGGKIDDQPPPWAGGDRSFFLGQDPEGNVFGVKKVEV